MAAKRQMYVKFETLLGGTTPVYLSTGPLLGSPANAYAVLDLTNLAQAEQTVSPLTGENTYPAFNFSVSDERYDPRAGYYQGDTSTMLYLLSQNKQWIKQTLVTVYEGTSATNYASFDPIWSGYVSDWAREEGAFTFEVGSIFKQLEQPIDFPTGSFQVAAGFDATKAHSVGLYKSVNLNPPARANLIDTAAATGGDPLTGWVTDAGSPTYNADNITMDGANTCTMHREVQVGTGATDLKLGACYTFWFHTNFNFGTSSADVPVHIQIEGRTSGGSVVDTYSFDQVRTHGSGGQAWVGVMYAVRDPSVTKVRLIITADDSVGPDTATIVKGVNFSTSNTWLIGREIVDIASYDVQTGLAQIVCRGGLGSLPSWHDVDEQGMLVTVLIGHPLNLARRLILTTDTVGGNGEYDAGDSLGLGARIPAALVSSNWDNERDWTDGGTAFSGYDHSKYAMLFLQTKKIDNLQGWLQENIMRPLHANMFVNSSGQLDVHLWRATETAGATTLTDSTIVLDDGMVELPMAYDETEIVNRVVARADLDPSASCDVQGNQSGGQDNFLREWIYDELSFGEESTTASSKALKGVYELPPILCAGVRGSASTRFGYCYALGGDQLLWETARKILTRYRWPLPTYQDFHGTFSRRSISIGDVPPLTHANAANMATGAWGRTAAKVAVEAIEMDYDTGEPTFRVRCVEDIVAIPNTTVEGGAPSAPADADVYQVAKAGSLSAELAQQMPIYPKDFANVIFVSLAKDQPYETLIYAYNSLASSPNPSNGDYQLVGELEPGVSYLHIPWDPEVTYASGGLASYGGKNWRSKISSNLNHTPAEDANWTEAGNSFYYCAISQKGGNSYTWVKIKYRNADRETSGFNTTARPGAGGYTVTGAAQHGNRGGKTEIRQIAGASSQGEATRTMSGGGL